MSQFFATRKLPVFLGALFASVLLAACSSDTPESVAEGFLMALANNRVDEALRYVPPEAVTDQDREKMRKNQENGNSYLQERGGLDSISTTLVDSTGDTAHVKAKIKFKNGKTEEETFTLSKKSGKWKVVAE